MSENVGDRVQKRLFCVDLAHVFSQSFSLRGRRFFFVEEFIMIQLICLYEYELHHDVIVWNQKKKRPARRTRTSPSGKRGGSTEDQ